MMFVCVYRHACMYIVCTYICMYVCMHACNKKVCDNKPSRTPCKISWTLCWRRWMRWMGMVGNVGLNGVVQHMHDDDVDDEDDGQSRLVRI